uniref:Uncharacterized protein n=1 Tax=Arundo donax TaxID=35708 RepID=A0A0A9GET1_ARUDO
MIFVCKMKRLVLVLLTPSNRTRRVN